MMRYLDKILENLRDANWHSFGEIEKGIYLPSDKLNELLSFLQKQAFINMKNGKLKITGLGLKFLDL